MNHHTEAARAVNILVVDDDARSRQALRAILSSTDCQVIEAGSGPEALKCLVRDDFALVLLDVVMPGMDGFEVASLIRERPRTRATPIIFLTGYAADVASVNKAYTKGAVDYLVKPLDRDIVRAKVEVFVELHRHREAVRRQAELVGEAEHRKLERLLDDRTRLHREAQEALRARDELLSAASHELRAPLTPLGLQIQSILHRIAREGELPEWVSAKLQVASRQVGRMSWLLDELLDVTRFTAGRLQLELEQVDLSALVRDVVEHFDEELVKCRSPVAVHTNTPVVGQWDRLRVEQIVTNLLSNAIKYGAGAPIEITVGVEGGAAVLAVRDHGIGIAPDDVMRIFERFERAAAARYREGLGLGLYIVRRLVEAHGGSIRVASSPGAGSTFTVELPLESASRPHQPPDGEAR